MQHTFQLGQLVRVVRSSSGSGDDRIYCVVCFLPSESDGSPLYRIKNTVGVERLVGPYEIEPASVTSVP